MTTAIEPAVLFRIPDDRDLPTGLRGYRLLDVPGDTQAALKTWEVAKKLDEEAGAALRYSLNSDPQMRRYSLSQARKIARLSAGLHAALRSLNDRWDGEDQDLPAAP